MVIRQDLRYESLTEHYVKLSCPFVQKRLFNYFARTLFRDTGELYPAFEDLMDTITGETLNVLNLLRRYETYLRHNREWLFKDAPRPAARAGSRTGEGLRVGRLCPHPVIYRA